MGRRWWREEEEGVDEMLEGGRDSEGAPVVSACLSPVLVLIKWLDAAMHEDVSGECLVCAVV